MSEIHWYEPSMRQKVYTERTSITSEIGNTSYADLRRKLALPRWSRVNSLCPPVLVRSLAPTFHFQLHMRGVHQMSSSTANCSLKLSWAKLKYHTDESTREKSRAEGTPPVHKASTSVFPSDGAEQFRHSVDENGRWFVVHCYHQSSSVESSD